MAAATKEQKEALKTDTAEGKEWFIAATDPFHDTALRNEGQPDSDNSRTVVLKISKGMTISNPDTTPGATNTYDVLIHNTNLDTLVPMLLGEASKQVKPVHGEYVPGTSPQWIFFEENAAGAVVFASQQIGAATLASVIAGPVMVHSWKTSRTDRKFFPDHSQVGPGSTQYTAPDTVNSLAPFQDSAAIATGLTGSSRFRVIGSGIEVVNTTAEIAKQGTLTSVRVPSRHESMPYIAVSATDGTASSTNNIKAIPNAAGSSATQTSTIMTSAEYVIMDGPPPTVSAALIQGGIQRKAADGLYAVHTFDPERTHIEQARMGYAGICNTPMDEGKQFANAPTVNYPNGLFASTHQLVTITGGGASGNDAYAQKTVPAVIHTNHQDLSAHYFTGLSAQTTLNLNVVWYVEVAPRAGDPQFAQLAPIATVSPPIDERAFTLYQEIARRIPPSVPQSMNPLGEWFSWLGKIAQTIAPVAYTVGKTLLDVVTGGSRNHQAAQQQIAASQVQQPVHVVGVKAIRASPATQAAVAKAKMKKPGATKKAASALAKIAQAKAVKKK